MRVAKTVLIRAAAVLIALASFAARASDELIIVKQDYSILEHSKEGFNAKNIRQELYITRDMLVIDEFGDNGTTPTETFMIDLKNERIINLDHSNKQILLNQSFADRRAQILKYKKQVERDIAATEKGAVLEKLKKMYGPMLDADRDFKIEAVDGTKKVGEAACKVVKIVDGKDPKYPAFESALHPDIELPYDNSDVLFLLKIVGEKMAQFLKDNKAVFGHVPMEMHLELAEGGKLDTKVVSVKKMKREEFDPKARSLGDPFAFPDGYTRVRKLEPK